jgi:hypothetical protein
MRSMRRSVTVLLAATLLLGVVACEKIPKVPKPSSDSTPPTLKWHVENQTTNVATDVVGSGTVSGKVGNDFRVTLIANDPEGIANITLGGGYSRSCVSGGAAQNATGSYTKQDQSLAPDAQGNVLTQIFLIRSVSPDVTCSGGYTLKSYTVGLNGTGTNYFSGTTNGTLTITITP